MKVDNFPLWFLYTNTVLAKTSKENWGYLSHYYTDKSFLGNVVNQRFRSKNGRSLEITSTCHFTGQSRSKLCSWIFTYSLSAVVLSFKLISYRCKFNFFTLNNYKMEKKANQQYQLIPRQNWPISTESFLRKGTWELSIKKSFTTELP